jgi:undecaprenyl-diphosphatase
LYSIIIGIIQGIAEWLPISSKTQILIASQYLFGLTFAQAYSFGLFMEIGTILASIIYFRKDLASMIKALSGSKDGSKKKLLVYVIVVTVITGIIGAPLYFIADSVTGISVGIPMLLLGIVLLIDALVIYHSKRRTKLGTNVRKFEDLNMKDYVIIGIAQGISALPGVSRSGITSSAMLFMNVEADEAFRLSFLVGIFAAIAASLLTVVASHGNVSTAINAIGITGLLIAMATATIISLFFIRFLIKMAGHARIVYIVTALGLIAIGSGCAYLFFGL